MTNENINQEFDILSFTADQLTVNTPVESKKTGNANIYKPKPADSKSDDGIYRAQIKIIYNPFDLRRSILEQQSYALQDAQGFFSVVSSLTDADTSCPVFKAWKTCHYSKDVNLQKQELGADKGGRGLFNKRFARYATIQVIEDLNNPELNGRYMFWKVPKAVYEVIDAKQRPTNPAKSPIPVMDFLFGRAIDLEVIPGPGKPGDETYTRQTSYRCEITEDIVSCLNPDCSPILNSEQQAIVDTYVDEIKKVWKEKDPARRQVMQQQIDMMPNTAQLKAMYRTVIEKIKSFCPNLIEEMGYKEWTPEVKERVQKWIDIVLQGNDPATISTAPGILVNNTSDPLAGTYDTLTAKPSSSVQQSPMTMVDDEDGDGDLPF